jgi:phosphohistidine phosphatase SixA
VRGRLAAVLAGCVLHALTAGPLAFAFEPAPLNSLVRCAAPPTPAEAGAGGGAAGEPAVQESPAEPAATPDAPAKGKEFPRLTPALVERMRAGGYVIVFRHSTTDWGQRDAEVASFEDRSAQRNLSAAGEAQAAQVGKAIASLEIPVGAVKASPMWRCRDTAQLAFGRHETTPDLFQRGGQSRAARVAMLSMPPDSGNLVLVTHQDVLIPIVAGLRRDQLREGDALVVKPLGGRKFEIEAQVAPEDWLALGAVSTK